MGFPPSLALPEPCPPQLLGMELRMNTVLPYSLYAAALGKGESVSAASALVPWIPLKDEDDDGLLFSFLVK